MWKCENEWLNDGLLRLKENRPDGCWSGDTTAAKIIYYERTPDAGQPQGIAPTIELNSRDRQQGVKSQRAPARWLLVGRQNGGRRKFLRRSATGSGRCYWLVSCFRLSTHTSAQKGSIQIILAP